MAPAVTETTESTIPIREHVTAKKGLKQAPLKYSGALDVYEYFDLTPTIGREFPTASITEILRAPNSDDLLRDLAYTISSRGVVFFRKQDDVTDEVQKEFNQRLGELAGKPKTSGLHIHPVINSGRENGAKDDEISVISSIEREKLLDYRNARAQSARIEWHSDITFEPIPSDYTSLRLITLPKTGGDTLWASGYEVYDRISPPYQKFLESLTATYAQPRFEEIAKEKNFELHPGPRGAPENVGNILKGSESEWRVQGRKRPSS